MLVTSIFSFSHNVFYQSQKEFLPFILSSANALNLEPITRRQILVSSKLKEFADDNFKLDENDRKLTKWVENTVGKGEIARYEQFLLFPQCFQKASFPGTSKGAIVWEWVKNLSFGKGLIG